jgi:hypothetical protein
MPKCHSTRHLIGARSVVAMVTTLAASVVVAGCGGSPREHMIITVGRGAITASLLDHWTSVMAPRQAIPEPPRFTACIKQLKELAQYPTSQARLKEACRRQYGELRQSALHLLITNQWLIEEVADRGARASKREIDGRLREKYASPEGELQLKALLGVGGRTPADLKLEVQAELAAERLSQRMVAYSLDISSRQIASYYRRNIHRFYLSERRYVELAGNLRGRYAARRIISRVRRGTNFARMSFHEWLERPNLRAIGEEKRILFRAIFRARPNVLVGPLRINGFYFLFRVTRTSPARVETLAEASKAIRKELSVRRRVRFVKSWRRKWTAETSCAPRYVVQKCKQYHGPPAPEDPVEIN